MKKNIRKIFALRMSVLLLFVTILIASLTVPLFHTSVARADTDEGCDDTDLFVEFGTGEAARKKIAQSITVQVISRGVVRVSVSLTDDLFADRGISNITYKDAFSGNYNWGEDPDGNWGFVFSKDLGVKVSNDDPLSIRGFVRPNGQIPAINAPQSEFDAWANNFEVYFGILQTTGTSSSDKYYYFVDEIGDGEYNGEWTCFSNVSSYDFPTTDTDRWHGFLKSDGFAVSSASNFAVNYVFDGKDINAIKSDKQDSDSFNLLTATSSPKNYFKENGGKKLLYNDDWDDKTKDWVIALFDTDKNVTVNLHDGSNITPVLVAGIKTAAGSDVAASLSIDNSQSCEVLGGAFSFILCPLLQIADQAFKWLDDRIVDALNVNASYYNNPGVKGAWANMRNIAYILLIPILLVMVISTALGFSFVDAYTVKRALPRLVIAIIFIALSFEITKLLVETSNIVGQGTAGIIATPFGGMDDLQLDQIFTPNAGDSVAFAGGALVAGIIAYIGFGVGIWAIAITIGLAVLSMIVVFVILTVREMLIIFLMILAPLAIIAWIFPGNDKMWKIWWSTFSKMLIFFPLIMALIVSGRAFASVVEVSGSDEGIVITTIIKLLAFISPYFFIPAAFKFAGGALGNLAGMVNNKSKGLFDRGREMRTKNMENNRKRNKTRGWVRPGGALGRTKLGGKITDLSKEAAALRNSFGTDDSLRDKLKKSNREAAKKRIHREEEGHAAEDKNLMTKYQNDNFVKAFQSIAAGDERAAMVELARNGIIGTEAEAEIAQMKTFYNTHGNSILGMAAIAKAGSKTSHIGGVTELFDDIDVGAHGDGVLFAETYAQARGAADRAGRYMLSKISFGEGLALGQANRLINQNGGRALAKDIEYTDEITGEKGVVKAGMTKEGINLRMKQKTLDAIGTYDWNGIHPSDAKNLVSSLGEDIETIQGNLAGNKYTDTEDADGNVVRTAAQNKDSDQRLLGQRVGQLQNMRANVASVGNGEIQRIVADGFDLIREKTKGGETYSFSIDGKDVNTLTDLINVGGSWPTREEMKDVMKDGQLVRQLVTVPVPEAEVSDEFKKIYAGFQSVSRSAGMTPEEKEMMRRQAQQRGESLNE